jgi:hypothetical protein
MAISAEFLATPRRKLCAGLASAALGGCAQAPVLTPVASGEPLRIVVNAAGSTGERLAIRNTALGDGASAGAGTGAVAGGLWGLTCGPFAVLCVPLGAAAGLLSGGAAGAAVGATGALPAEKADRLRERFARTWSAPALVDELRREVVERARARWTLVDDAAAATLVLEMKALELDSTRDEHIGLILHVAASVRAASAPSSPAPAPRQYDYVGPRAPLVVWLDEGSDFLATSFANAMRQIAAQVVAEMVQR